MPLVHLSDDPDGNELTHEALNLNDRPLPPLELQSCKVLPIRHLQGDSTHRLVVSVVDEGHPPCFAQQSLRLLRCLRCSLDEHGGFQHLESGLHYVGGDFLLVARLGSNFDLPHHRHLLGDHTALRVPVQDRALIGRARLAPVGGVVDHVAIVAREVDRQVIDKLSRCLRERRGCTGLRASCPLLLLPSWSPGRGGASAGRGLILGSCGGFIGSQEGWRPS
mmetsp:Transcript_26265/g.59609  ORF Transcript_26265/g.59609 Transcript_26265/m.59609 type:complete len:221 (+) Transcript_26265:756-1418(+)